MTDMQKQLVKSKEFIGSIVTLVLLFAVICLSLVIMMDPTFGWFSQNRRVEGNGVETGLDELDAAAEYFAYVYDVKDLTVHYTGEGRTNDQGANIDPTISNLDMQFHDTIFLQRNRYTPAIIRIRVYGLREDLRSGGTVAVTLGRNTALPAYVIRGGAPHMTEYLTSIMRFTLAQNDAWYSANAETLYENIDAALYTKIVTNKNYTPAGSSAVYTTVTKSGDVVTDISKVDSITLRIAYSAADAADGEMDIYLYVTYDGDLVGEFNTAAGIDTSTTTVGQITTMTNDLATLEIRFE